MNSAPMTLKSYLSAIILTTITLIIVISGTLLIFVTKQTYLDGLSQRGTELAKVIASDPSVINTAKHSNQGSQASASLQSYIEAIRAKTNASYIVVTNLDGIRLSHPNGANVGKKFIGDDIQQTLQYGTVRTTVDTGSLGKAIRNFAPIMDNNAIIGAVSIGYLDQSTTQLLLNYYFEGTLWLGLIYIIAIVLTLALISKLKRTFLRYEPEEIVQRFKEHHLLLTNIREGIIAVDKQHRVTAINEAASGWLAPERQVQSLINLPLSELSQGLCHLISDSLASRYKHSATIGRHDFAVSLYPLNTEADQSGYLIVLNHEQEMSELERELTRTTAYANQLRSKTHEHNNQLNVISGLLQSNRIQEAINYLQTESDAHQQLLGNLVRNIENSPVAGMLLAKYNYAVDNGIAFRLDEDSQLKNYQQSVNDDLITLLGNLIENAFYAALDHADQQTPEATLFISDRTNHLMVTIEDSGKGVDSKLADKICDLGVSSKEDQTQHGMGLYLVSKVVNRYNGSIDWERVDNRTTVFSVYLDKRELEK